MKDDRRRTPTPGELLDQAIAQLAQRVGADLAEGNWQLVAHLQRGDIRKVDLLPVSSSVRITVGAREMFRDHEEAK